ncbi:PI4KB_4 [Blepharisma stoltei]|uniref:1-phosphatidylinositol 4-kinase n=1 Tax=Blepharisma stoltei TaxID=1481888 RepID=A0AAU9IPB8_9CILI|nr:unnamed protein product [Blepharisma stoltei]
MDKSISISTPLVPPPPPRKQGCIRSIFRLLCCCCVKNSLSIRTERKKFWVKIRDRLLKKKHFDQVYITLLNLYSHQHVISDLEKCQVSPDFRKKKREDLEFYVPQLCNLLLFGFLDHNEDLIRAVLEFCKTSFHFSHRVYWFLKSTDFSLLDLPGIDPDHLIESVEKVSQESHPIYLGKGTELFQLMVSMGMEFNLNSSKKSFSDILEEEPEDIAILRDLIHEYNLTGKVESDIPDKINPKYIPLNPFPKGNIVDGYHSTLWFVEKLTQISIRILHSPKKSETLKEELKELNQLLPACAYIPFNNPIARNCAVLHIIANEARVFTTKERAPYKICVEIFRPYEELLVLDPSKSASALDRRSASVPSVRSFHLNKTVIEEIKSETTDDGFDEIIKAIQKESETNRKHRETIDVARSRPPALSSSYIHYDRLSIFGQPGNGDLEAVYGGEEEDDQTDKEESIDETNKRAIFKESFKEMAERIRSKSPFGKLKTWDLLHIIVKSGDDLRQEQLAMQLISFFQQTWREKKLDLWLYAYDIIATGEGCGILECVPDAISIDGLKKDLPTDQKTLHHFFQMQFGGEKSKRSKRAKREFMKSLAGYSLLCYILQIKDRHNGNILIDRHGHLIHIDFGFMFSNSPGGNINFEKAPFKLTDEFERVLGGRRSKLFIEFRSLCVKGFIALKEKAEQIVLLVEMMRFGSGASLGCFVGGEEVTRGLRERLLPRESMSEGDCKEYINLLIDESLDNWTTRCYDRFQYCCQNIFY